MSHLINKAGAKAPLLLAGASVGLVSWNQQHQHQHPHHQHHKDRAAARAAKQYVLTSPRGIWAIASPAPAQCEGSSAAGGPNGRQPVFVSDRVKVAAEAEARLRAMNMLRDVVSMWETSTDSDTRPW